MDKVRTLILSVLYNECLTLLIFSILPCKTANPFITATPAMIAFVVAIAGIILPAIAILLKQKKEISLVNIRLTVTKTRVYRHLTSNRLFCGILKMCARIFAVAVTKSSASSSSLSNDRILPSGSARSCSDSRVTLSLNTSKHSSNVHTFWSLIPPRVSFNDCNTEGLLDIVLYFNGLGGVRCFHISFMLNNRSISDEKTYTISFIVKENRTCRSSFVSFTLSNTSWG